MTYEQWEAKLKELLADASEEEINEAVGYYKEIYSDKKDAGLSDEEILREFGTPEDCAGRISVYDEPENNAKEAELPTEKEFGLKDFMTKFKVPFTTSVVGAVFFAIFITIPLFAVLLGGISAFAAVALGGAGLAVGGVGMIVLSFVQLFMGSGVSQFFAIIGMGGASAGAGVLCAISFFFITKYTVLFSYKLFKSMYIKEVNENEGN
jgi:uncharacterized membrane protein